jgi:receptor-binding and translocation channel-forming TcA subunit of Tc toxin
MAQPVHQENFVAIRTLHPRVTWRPVSRYRVVNPIAAEERDYRDLLSEANEDFFHREYGIALQNYLDLRHKILVQSHPELPREHGYIDWTRFDVSVVDPARIFELSRRVIVKPKPGEPITIPATDDRVIFLDEIVPNPAFGKLQRVGVDPGVSSAIELSSARRSARELVLEQRLPEATKTYRAEVGKAVDAGDFQLAADLTAESAGVLATYSSKGRPAALKRAIQGFSQASNYYELLGDTAGATAMQANIAQAREELGQTTKAREAVGLVPANATILMASGTVNLRDVAAGHLALHDGQLGESVEATVRRGDLPKPATTKAYLAPADGIWKVSGALVTSVAARPEEVRTLGLLTSRGVKEISLAADKYQNQLVKQVYERRVNTKSLVDLAFDEIVPAQFVAYIPHLFFYVLPVAIGDTYLALGQYQLALDQYESVLRYPYLNQNIEVPDLWQRIAKTYLKWGDELFRRGLPADAQARYANLIGADGTVSAGSPLYSAGAFASILTQAREVAKKLAGQPSAAVNPRVAQAVSSAYVQLQKITAGLNFLGLSDDYYPVHRFKFLQAAANYLADNAVQAERTFIQFRAAAEQQKMDRIQLESAVRVNAVALESERKRLDDAALERNAASQTRQLANLRRQHAQDNLTDWDTIGAELASVNAALAWASNAANSQKINYTGVQYHGTSHDYSGDVEDFYDTVGEVREWLNFDLQRNRLDRQIAEAAAEVAITQTREQQAQVRFQVQQLNVELAATRLEGAQEILAYADDRMFDEDLWFKLAGELEDLARDYLDMAIYAAFVMQRGYDLEFDRNLGRIRLDYGIGGTESLLGGDYLKRDIASFTVDYLEHAQKQNPLRLVVSLREEFPQAYLNFQAEGILPFRTDLEIFDRRYPGSFRRKLKRVEVFVEGLVPSEGAHGSLQHDGISTEWRDLGAGWVKHFRVLPVERMMLSSYQFRRDIAVFQLSEELLGLFENVGPQGNWTLELPKSANNLDLQAISDVKVVLYLDSDYDAGLEQHVKAFYATAGGRSLVLSCRFHYPDQYFRLDADRKVAFTLPAQRFAYNYEALALTALTVRLLPADPTTPVGAQALTVTRDSDAASVTAVTDNEGVLAGDATTMAPFGAWKGASPIDTFTVTFPAGLDLDTISDVHLALSYGFTYRADGTL